ncbi:MAG TPA: hypothetical protein VFK05_15300 [Polyangiaceae bacterium]|nr:hypothetical protein [Polyangiaceae bacterium]
MLAPLLTLVLTHCGGRASGTSQSANAGSSAAGEAASEATATSGSSGLAGGAAPDLSPGDHTIIVDADAGTPICNSLGDTIIVTPRITWDNPPTPQGGMIANGFYYLSKREDYVGLAAVSNARPGAASAALVISESTGGSAQAQLRWMDVIGELPYPVRLSEAITLRGTSYDYTVTCGLPAASGSMSFTATPNQLLWIYPDSDGGTMVDTFQRQ